MIPDILLQLFIKLALVEADATDGLRKRGITVYVGGLLASGHLISARDFATHNHLTDYILEKVDLLESGGELEDEYGQKKQDDDLPEFIHLSNAHFFTPGQTPIPSTSDGVFWRCRLSDVSGFHLGVLKTDANGPLSDFPDASS
jgi:hypothetical protein